MVNWIQKLISNTYSAISKLIEQQVTFETHKSELDKKPTITTFAAKYT